VSEDLFGGSAFQGIPESRQGLTQDEGAIRMWPPFVFEGLDDSICGGHVFWSQAHSDDPVSGPFG
jgi:hypothetical protein